MSTPSSAAPAVNHLVRTFVAAIFGIIAFVFILASILVVWVNRTVLDTPTYVSTVAPAVAQADAQDFVASKAAEQLISNAPTQDIAAILLEPSQIAGKTDEQLKVALEPVVKASVLQVVGSPKFAELWKETHQAAHADFIRQLKAGGSELNLDLSPAVAGVMTQLKETKLAPIVEKLSEKPIEAKLNLKGSTLDQVYVYYRVFTQATLALLLATSVCIVLSVWISVNHAKTLRRIVLGTGVLSLVLAIILQAPQLVGPKLEGTEQKAAAAIASVLLHNLQMATLVLGLVCIVLAIASKFLLKPRS